MLLHLLFNFEHGLGESLESMKMALQQLSDDPSASEGLKCLDDVSKMWPEASATDPSEVREQLGGIQDLLECCSAQFCFVLSPIQVV